MKSTRRIGLLLTLVFLLPALFFSVYELSSLDKDEEMIEQIYSKQLEAILFSVNQYSDDVLGNWASRIETSLGNPEWLPADSVPNKIKDLLNFNASLKAIVISDTVDWKPSLKIFSQEDFLIDPVREEMEWALQGNVGLVQQLVQYKKSGFQKVERLKLNDGDSALHCLIYISQLRANEFRVTCLLIDVTAFIEDIVGPRLQSIARDQFVLSAMVKGTDSVLYTTALGPGPEPETPTEVLTKEFWIFPDYALGIRTSGDTLQQLVRERTRTNLALLVALDIILIIAVVLVFRNLKREVDLAQNKADFVSNVSHEIRTPLALISMFAETLDLDRVPSEEKKREYYRIISKETQRLTGIVNKILNFSQTEAKKKTFTIDRLDLNREIMGILNTYDFHLSNKGFQYTLAASGELWIRGDREALMEAMINLIDNAMKYSEDEKLLEITSGRKGDEGFVSVKDRGVGISREHQKHIFDKFYRVHKGNLARSRGTGLGLSLVKQLMESQKGRISVESEPGKGSTFTLFFPLD
jgi:two-component system, OmpR family, phosphate regulon sensor histidine kinase PhoR